MSDAFKISPSLSLCSRLVSPFLPPSPLLPVNLPSFLRSSPALFAPLSPSSLSRSLCLSYSTPIPPLPRLFLLPPVVCPPSISLLPLTLFSSLFFYRSLLPLFAFFTYFYFSLSPYINVFLYVSLCVMHDCVCL